MTGVATSRSLQKVKVHIDKNFLKNRDAPVFYGEDVKLALYKVLDNNSTLKELSLENLILGRTELAGIESGLTQNSTLTHLAIPGSLLDWSGLSKFLEFTGLNESLKELDISGSRATLESVEATPEETVWNVYASLEKSKGLTTLVAENWFWDYENESFSDSVSIHVMNAKTQLRKNLDKITESEIIN